MEFSQRYQPRLIGLSLGVVLALLIWPATRWLIRSQLALVISTPASVAPWSIGAESRQYEQRNLRETAARHPEDLSVQLAAAIELPPAEGGLTPDIRVARLRELAQRFPDRPTIYAACLRFAVQNQVKVDREEADQLFSDGSSHYQPAIKGIHNTPEQLSAFDRDAEIGERLDPDNAYFPFMRSAGLFAAHRDADALVALERAAHKPAWTEYYNDELEGSWKLHEEASGAGSVLPRMAAAYCILFPHYSALRAASHVATAKAIQAEQEGRSAEGIAIRNAVRQCGALMRVQSPSLIGNLIGIAITRVSLLRPGGAPLGTDTSGIGQDRLREQQLRAYDVFLQRTGHAEQIAAVDAEIAAGVRTREIAKFATRSLSPLDTAPKLVLWWVAGMAALSGALWMLLLGGAAALLARHRSIRTGQGLPSSVRSGAGLGLLAGMLLAGVETVQTAYQVSQLYLIGIPFVGILTLALPAASGSDRLRRLGAFALSLIVTALLCAAFVWQAGGSIGSPMQMMCLFNSGEGANHGPTVAQFYLLAVAIAAVIPCVTLLILSLLSLLWRVPLSVGVARGLRGCGAPIACTLLLIYGMMVPITLRYENSINEALKRSAQHDGRYIAELSGNEWPGPVR